MKPYSLKEKIVRSHSLIIAGILIVLELVVFLIVSRIQLVDAAKLNQTLIQTMGAGFDNSVKAFRGQMNFITMSDELQSELRKHPQDETKQLLRKSSLQSAIVMNTLVINELDAAYLYEKDRSLAVYWQKRPTTSNTYPLFAEMPGLIYPDNGAIAMNLYEEQLVFSRKILDLTDREPLGYCALVYEKDKLEALLDLITPDSNRLVALVAPDGRIASSNQNHDEGLWKILGELKEHGDEIGESVWEWRGRERVLVSSYETKVDKWHLVCLVRSRHLLTSVHVTAGAIFFIGILGIIVGTIIEQRVANRMVSPITELIQQVRRIEKEDYSMRNEVHTADELEVLGHSVNHMSDRINVLVNQVLKQEIGYRDMQLQALQAQINPHFLYNTLECINSLAQQGRKEEVREVTVAFSNVTKSLLKESREVTVKEELNFVKDFLKIYQIMLGDKLSYQIEVQEDLETFRIPRMTIQPLVENAVLHGIKSCTWDGNVSVSVVSVKKGVLISVNDDGLGMEQEQLGTIREYLENPDGDIKKDGIGVGMKNVIRRLYLYYGKNVEIHISSIPDMGTTIDCILSVKTEDIM